MNGTTPCHATLTEPARAIDAHALTDVLGALCRNDGSASHHIAIDGKTMRASKNGEVTPRMCWRRSAAVCKRSSGMRPRAGQGMEIPDALKLLERLGSKGKIVTVDAMFCQKSITAKIVERGGDYIPPVKDNQKNLRRNIETAFNEPVFPPRLV